MRTKNSPGLAREKVDSLSVRFRSLGELLSERAKELGSQPVCVFFQDDTAITYAELNQEADRLAASLQLLGVRKGTHVAVMIPNVREFPITLFALARLGAPMVPVNTSYTSAELNYVLGDSDAQFLIIHESFADVLGGINSLPRLIDHSRIVGIGDGSMNAGVRWSELLDRPAADTTNFPNVTNTDCASIQFTSGTTGFSKACVLSHQYWLRLAGGMADNMALYKPRRFLLACPLYYMEGQWELIANLLLGNTQFVARKMSASKFIDWIRDFQIHWCWFPQYVAITQPPAPRDAETNLRYVSSLGYSGPIQRKFTERFNVRAQDAYGMTEIGMGTIMPADADHMVGSGSCGLAAPMRELKIVDENGREVADGEVGELWVAGPDILSGYYGKPEANAKSFTGKWFHTGDLFRRDENGYYYIVGRIKEMIKRSGENISAREVEMVLKKIPGVEEAAVVPVPDPVRHEEVKAYIIRSTDAVGSALRPETVLEESRKSLAAFKIPRYIEFVDDMPRTDASAKVAKTKLIQSKSDLRAGSYDSVVGKWL